MTNIIYAEDMHLSVKPKLILFICFFFSIFYNTISSFEKYERTMFSISIFKILEIDS